jgi:hypothetical protein
MGARVYLLAPLRVGSRSNIAAADTGGAAAIASSRNR